MFPEAIRKLGGHEVGADGVLRVDDPEAEILCLSELD